MQVVVYTRNACPLCDKGIAAARAVFGAANVTLVDVDLDIELLETYSNRVPVVETPEGVCIAEGPISESALRDFNSRS
jgi:hypothetical protein